jgi:signal transduction histidine kinase
MKHSESFCRRVMPVRLKRMLTESDRETAARAGISWASTIELPGVRASVPTARRHVRKVLGDGAGDAELVVSELVTNAMAHSDSGKGGTIILKLAVGAERVRVEVTDAGSATSRPRLARHALEDENGRGLEIVRAVSLAWGATGTTVWCECRRERAGTTA